MGIGGAEGDRAAEAVAVRRGRGPRRKDSPTGVTGGVRRGLQGERDKGCSVHGEQG